MNFPPAFHVLEELPSEEPAPRLDAVPRIAAAPLVTKAVLHRREITQADLDRAGEEGVERGRAAAVAHYEMKLQEQRQGWASELQAERERWEEAAGKQLWESVERSMCSVHQDLAATLVGVIAPFIRRKLSEAALQDMTQSVIETLSHSGDMKISIVGPSQLVEAFQEAVDGRASVSAMIDESSCDLFVRIGTSVMSTQIGEWLNKLELEN